jgi:hypothetical protein
MEKLAEYGLAGLILLFVFSAIGTLGYWAKGWVDKFLDRSLIAFDKHAEAASKNAEASEKQAESMAAITGLVIDIKSKLEKAHSDIISSQRDIVGYVNQVKDAVKDIVHRPSDHKPS